MEIMPDQAQEIRDLLRDIRAEVKATRDEFSAFRQDSERRIATLEERASAKRFDKLEAELEELKQDHVAMRTASKIYAGLAGALGGGTGLLAHFAGWLK